MLPWIGAVHFSSSTTVAMFGYVEPARSSSSKKDFNTSPRRFTKCCRIATMQSRSDAARSFPEDMSAIDLESPRERFCWHHVISGFVSFVSVDLVLSNYDVFVWLCFWPRHVMHHNFLLGSVLSVTSSFPNVCDSNSNFSIAWNRLVAMVGISILFIAPAVFIYLPAAVNT